MKRWLALGRRLFSSARRHPKTAIGLALSVGVWFWLVVWLYWSGAAAKEWQSWIELFNGATWPNDWERQHGKQPFVFALALATRTVANVAGVIGGVAAAVYFLSGGLERYMHMSQIDLLRMHTAEMVSSMAAVLKKKHPEINVEDEVEMQQVADDLLNAWLKETKAFSSDQPERQAALSG